MIITYLRSSSVSSFSWCQHKYWIQYNLGIQEESNKKAQKGNVVHKGLELLANKKLCLQNKQDLFKDAELDLEFSVGDLTPDTAIKYAFDHYKSKSSHDWDDKDFKECNKWLWDVLLFNSGMFSPLTRNIVMPEQYFDIEINKPWAKYEYFLDDGTVISGNLRIKGTMDLITRIGEKSIEYIDWKTGERKNWSTGKEKGYDDLKKDFQLCLYHYALDHLYPNEDMIMMTIFFVKAGGPFSLCFDKRDIPTTEEMIRKEFEKIKYCQRPSRIIDYGKDKWKCERLCKFHKEKHYQDENKNICTYLHEELIELGIKKAYIKHADKSIISSYGDGGGQSNRENKNA
jgi:hypothetical protein